MLLKARQLRQFQVLRRVSLHSFAHAMWKTVSLQAKTVGETKNGCVRERGLVRWCSRQKRPQALATR
jgi:hypothetical protein